MFWRGKVSPKIVLAQDKNQLMRCFAAILSIIFLLAGCQAPADQEARRDSLALQAVDTLSDTPIEAPKKDTSTRIIDPLYINTGAVQPADIVAYAKTLIGVPYRYGSTDPSNGFDCSGFITYVFNHFDVRVPRSSIDFTNVGRTVDLDSVKPGDLVLFTGTDSTERFVGHMGIITENKAGAVSFIHSTSGKAYGVTITPLNKYYMWRYVRSARIFASNED